MYKLIFILFISFLSAQQSCKLSFSNNYLSENGKIIFSIKNIGGKKIKIPLFFNADFARPTDIEVYSAEKKDYIDTRYSFDGFVRRCKRMFWKNDLSQERRSQRI